MRYCHCIGILVQSPLSLVISLNFFNINYPARTSFTICFGGIILLYFSSSLIKVCIVFSATVREINPTSVPHFIWPASRSWNLLADLLSSSSLSDPFHKILDLKFCSYGTVSYLVTKCQFCYHSESFHFNVPH